MPEVICPVCRGRGLFTDPATGKTSLCERCGGTGTVPYTPARSRPARGFSLTPSPRPCRWK